MPTDDNGQPVGESQSSANAGQPTIDKSKWIEMERYNGLQGKYQQVFDENKTLKASLHDVTGKSEEQLATLQSDVKRLTDFKTTYETQLAALTQERDTFKNQTAQFQSELEVAKAILDPKYQPLQPLYAKGLLSVSGKSGDDLTKYLDEFANTLQTQTAQGVEQRLSGATPATPTGGTSPTVKELEDAMFKALPGTPEYQKARDAWRAAIVRTAP